MGNKIILASAETLLKRASYILPSLGVWEVKAIKFVQSMSLLAVDKINKLVHVLKYDGSKISLVSEIKFSNDSKGELIAYDIKDYTIALAFNTQTIVIYSLISGKKLYYLSTGSQSNKYPGYIPNTSCPNGISQLRVSNCNIIGSNGNLLLVYAFF